MRLLPCEDNSFAEVTDLWCLCRLDDSLSALTEAKRILRPGGRYFACTAARDSDPEILPEGCPRSTFDAEEATDIVAAVFDRVEGQRWNGWGFSSRWRQWTRSAPW
jgi:SAM-dependent methyltransferase